MSKSVGIRTELLAQMAGVSEAELVHALKTTGEILGIKIPSPLPPFPKNITPEREILIFLKVKHLQIKSPLSELQPRERNEIKSGFTPVRNIGVNLKRLSGQVKGYKKSIGAETLIWR